MTKKAAQYFFYQKRTDLEAQHAREMVDHGTQETDKYGIGLQEMAKQTKHIGNR